MRFLYALRLVALSGWISVGWMVPVLAATVESAPRLTAEEARGLVSEVVPRVEELRGLRFKQTVPVEVVSDAVAREHFLARLRQFDQEERLGQVQRAYELLGLVPRGTDMLVLLLDTMEEQAGGFYDPARSAYFLLEDVPSAVAPILTAHELTHALEDQHFDLDRRLREALEDDDRLLARSAVHEGSATILMSLYAANAMLRGEMEAGALQALAETEAGQAARLRALPDVLIRQILGPYVLGMTFLSGGDLMAIVQGFPEESVRRAYLDGPESSEQLLHPEKFWDDETRDDPVPVTVPSPAGLLGKRWSLAADGVLGELTIAVLVGAETPVPTGPDVLDTGAWTNEAATGWGGDRWQVWAKGRKTVLLLLTIWDSAADASEFAAALPEGQGMEWRVADRRVAIVAGDTGRKASRLLDRMLARTTPPAD